MTDKEKILAFLEGISKGCCPNETKEIIINKIIPWINSLPEESVSRCLEDAAINHAESLGYTSEDYEYKEIVESYKAGAQWKLSKLPKWKKAINRSCWSGEIGVNPTKRRFEYEHYVIDADKLFEALEKEE